MAPLGWVVDPGLKSSATIWTFPCTRAEPSLPKAQYNYGSRDILSASITENARSRISSRMVNPSRNIPKAIRCFHVCILLPFIGGALIIGLLAPSNHPSLDLTTGDATASPFYPTYWHQGIAVRDHTALFTSAWSTASSDLFASSPALCGLSLAVNVPKVFSNVSSGKGKALNWFANMTAVAGLMTWFGIPVTCMRFYVGMKAQGIDRCPLHFSSGLHPFVARYAMIFRFLICFWVIFPFPSHITTIRQSWLTRPASSVRVLMPQTIRYRAVARPIPQRPYLEPDDSLYRWVSRQSEHRSSSTTFMLS
ncbi:amino acid permease [Rhizoctonia solani]|uniref:Amino acid permease n=1 Tax=Rhizoctonia solani TaxID=456999 RepID=A0A8H8P4G4_9AGAM|nr:amino acid permease [Rhizoctonia solani]QRW24468.1 amino acid permease [Rhizoctonia solani]